MYDFKNTKWKGKFTSPLLIEEEHFKQLKTSGAFPLSSPLSLFRNVWFHTVLSFCRRGRKRNIGALTTKSFKFAVAAAGALSLFQFNSSEN